MKECKYCKNGYIYAESGSSQRIVCPDCDGTGWIKEEGIDFWVCPKCGEEVDYPLEEGEICKSCQENLY